ncbi:MAG: hypothetical protein KBF88_06340 [Polyangiaceae bacterium]|nr:hypothetical protein [Polyangiaceae bacterium]
MMKRTHKGLIAGVGGIVVSGALMIGCSDTAAPADDAQVAVDAAVEAATPAGDYYELGAARTIPMVVECRTGGGGYVISGRASDRTGFTFYFQAAPSAGTYTVEGFPAPPNTVPANAMGALVRYSRDPGGGAPDEAHEGTTGGSVTVSLADGKLRATASGLPVVERGSKAAGTASAVLTCP